MRKYQEEIYNALVSKEKTWGGSNSVVNTDKNITEVFYYGNKIAIVNHETKCATFDNCGYNNASTTARINAVKEFCNDYCYTY
jgi:hypothetical protein